MLLIKVIFKKILPAALLIWNRVEIIMKLVKNKGLLHTNHHYFRLSRECDANLAQKFYDFMVAHQLKSTLQA